MNKSIFSNNPLVIAEMANSHEGKLSQAKEITEAAARSGANAIKYQKFTAKELAEPTHELYSLYQKLEMSLTEWNNLISFAQSKKLKVFVDIFGIKSLKDFSKFKIDGYKIHSADVSNPTILNYFSSKNTPILLSVAGSLPNEIDNALRILSKTKKEIVLMHGFQGYPTKINDLNLLRIHSLENKFGLPVGLMDHLSGDSQIASQIPLLGIAMGAQVIEKHITLDRSLKGLDYYSALNPDEFSNMVSSIKMIKKSFGSSKLDLSKNEITYRLQHKKNPISKKSIKKDSILKSNQFNYLRSKQKVSAVMDFDGKILSKNIKKDTILTKNYLKKSTKIAAIIACRVDSSRLFAKPLQLVNRIPIISLLINQLKKSKRIDEIVLAISENPGNEFFINFARENKIKFVTGNDTDVLKRLIQGAEYVNADIIFRTTAENPFIYWEGIDDVIDSHISKKSDFTVVEDVPLGCGFEIINTDAFRKSHTKGTKKHRSELCSLYIFENQNKFKIQKYIPPKLFQRPEIRLTVDNPQDLWVVRIISDNLQSNGKPIKLHKIISFLDSHPEVLKLNSGIPIGKSRIW
jgi:N,N'-diacetyllegionaminate synthase